MSTMESTPAFDADSGLPEQLSGVDPVDFDSHIDGLRYCCRLVLLPGADRLHIALRSTVPQPEETPPRFVRYQSTEAMRGHVLSICDPTLFLSPTLRISGFLGTAAQDPIPTVIYLSEIVAERLGVDRSRIVYWGSSASGLGAAMAAIRSGDGQAVLVNPLLNVRDFRATAAAPPILGVFDGGDLDTVFATYPERMSVAAALAAAQAKGEAPRLLLVQNIRDQRFYKMQFLPFCEAHGIPTDGGSSADGTLRSMVYASDDGHGLEPPEVLDRIIREGFPLAPAAPPIELGEPNRFCDGDHRLWMQDISGLGRAERTHRWTIGDSAKLTFLLPEDCPANLSLQLEARGYVADDAPTVTADILVNGVHVGLLEDNIAAAERALPVTVDLPDGAVGPDKRVTLELRIRDPRSPKSLGASPDERELGFNLLELTVKARGADAAPSVP